jgi:hypothetical protein
LLMSFTHKNGKWINYFFVFISIAVNLCYHYW